MKRLLCICISALLIFGCVTAVHAADSYLSLNGFTFEINDDSEAVIYEYDDRAADVVIPNKLLGAFVTEISDYAFFGDTYITSVELSKATHLKRIGDNAFYGCTGLKNLTIPSNIEELSFGSFQNCSGLATVYIKSGVTVIPTQCFLGCSMLSKVTIPASVTTIEPLAFDGCDQLVIYCENNSYALEYAIENEIDYVIIGSDPHTSTFVRGDSNDDGKVSVIDVTWIQKFLAGESVTPFNRSAADIDENGLDINDATNIQRYLARFDDPYNIGQVITRDEYELPFAPDN